MIKPERRLMFISAVPEQLSNDHNNWLRIINECFKQRSKKAHALAFHSTVFRNNEGHIVLLTLQSDAPLMGNNENGKWTGVFQTNKGIVQCNATIIAFSKYTVPPEEIDMLNIAPIWYINTLNKTALLTDRGTDKEFSELKWRNFRAKRRKKAGE